MASPLTICMVIVGTSNDKFDSATIEDARKEVDELVLVKNPNAVFGGLGVIANNILDRTPCDVFGIVHADTRFGHGALHAFAETTIPNKVAGIVGRSISGEYVWSRSVDNETPVSTLDCCSVFFSPKCEFRFDATTFDGFHCVVEDICLTAAALGSAIVVPKAVADHLGDLHLQPAWQADYHMYRQKLLAKWAGTPFTMT